MTVRALALLVPRSLRQHALATVVTACSVALGTGLVLAVFAIRDQTATAFTGGPLGFDGVLGARGSKTQLVLNSVFHLDTSPGNVPWALYQEIATDPGVAAAVPFVVGDNYRGFRIVGTTRGLFEDFEYHRERPLRLQPARRLIDGVVQDAAHVFAPDRREAVIGAEVARRTRLAPGDEFEPVHGLAAEGKERHGAYLVVGVLEPTYSPMDRVILIPIEGAFRMEGHVLRGDGKNYVPGAGARIPDAHKEVSAVLVKLKSPIAGFQLDERVNRLGKVATFAWPVGAAMAELWDKIGWVNQVLALVAVLVCVVAAAAILAALYNTMNERRREFAILRALGATRSTILAAVTGEAALVALLGTLGGYAVGAVIVATASGVVRAQTGVWLDVWQWHPITWWMPAAALAVGALAGLIPAVKAYRTDVATHLAPQT